MNKTLTFRKGFRLALISSLLSSLAGCGLPQQIESWGDETPAPAPKPTVLYQPAASTLNASYDEGVAAGERLQAKHDAAKIAAAKAACTPVAPPIVSTTSAAQAAPLPAAVPAADDTADLPLPPVTNSFNSQGPARPLSPNPF